VCVGPTKQCRPRRTLARSPRVQLKLDSHDPPTVIHHSFAEIIRQTGPGPEASSMIRPCRSVRTVSSAADGPGLAVRPASPARRRHACRSHR
jgi:hypothetical protein